MASHAWLSFVTHARPDTDWRSGRCDAGPLPPDAFVPGLFIFDRESAQ